MANKAMLEVLRDGLIKEKFESYDCEKAKAYMKGWEAVDHEYEYEFLVEQCDWVIGSDEYDIFCEAYSMREVVESYLNIQSVSLPVIDPYYKKSFNSSIFENFESRFDKIDK